MKSYAVIGVFLALTKANLDVITLNTKSGNYIQEAEATLVLGNVPNPPAGDVALWSAIMMDKKDFLQGVTENAAQRSVATHQSYMFFRDGQLMSSQSVLSQSGKELV
jgi:hypothetical protein